MKVNRWIVWLGLGIALLALSPFARLRWDISEDKKFTLSESTIKALNALDGPIRVQVYLGGDGLPGGFKRLEKAILSILSDIKSQSPQTIEIEQIDLYAEYPNEEDRERMIFRLDSLGLPPTNIVNKQDGKQVQQLAFPGLVITKGERSLGVLLLKGNQSANPQEVLNQSIEGLEYEIMLGIQTLAQTERKNIGFLMEYNRLPAVKQLSLISALRKRYDLYPVDLGASISLDGLDAICLIQPDQKFSLLDQYKIDQFLVKGGKAIFFMEGVRTDTIANQGLVSSPIDVGLNALFFRYGLRLNSNWVKDAQLSGVIPLAVGNFGNKANIELMPWPAFPLLAGNPASLITKNLDAVYGRFVSSIDTVSSDMQLTKTPLLRTSQYTQIQQAPATLPFASTGKDFDPAKYKAGSQVIAYLVEGKFRSVFLNRPLPNDSLQKTFSSQSQNSGGIIVVGDGDIAINGIDPETKGPMALGFDPFTKHTFANVDFILNGFQYLLDDQQALLARSKNIRLRPLDKGRIQSEKGFWQGLNMLIPLLFGSIFSLGVILYRRWKYNQ
jgi:ABC-2 type transport system permease protein